MKSDFQIRLSINMALLAVLGTVLLGMGQQDATLPLLTATVAIMAVYFTDIRRWFHLNHMVANGAALVAVGISLFDFARFDRNEQLLAIANLLVYLQIVVLFQEKNTRIYWQMAMLSLLQVVVAAALNFSVIFGLLLVVYLYVGLTALTRFYLFREATRVEQDGATVAEPFLWPIFWRRRKPELHELQFASGHGAELEQITARRGVLRIVARMGAVSLLLTVVVFFSIPRFGQTAWRSAPGSPQRVVGFSQQVKLDALGAVLQNPEVVMRLQFIDDNHGSAFKLAGEPLLRGSVVTHYSPELRQWSYRKSYYRDEVVPLPMVNGQQGIIRQRITLEPLNEPVVFSVYPALRYGKQNLVRYDVNRKQLFRSDRLRKSQLNFDMATSGIQDGRQYPVTPFDGRYRELFQMVYIPTYEDGRDPFVGLRRVADEVLDDARIPRDDHYLVAQTLESHLRSLGGFQYSLMPQERTEGLDPIEDFVLNTKTGHCEYFASALTLMLRSQGIPSRMVIGYKGGEWNSMGGFYQVRQLHAHTWVEAYLDPEQLAQREIKVGDSDRFGGWLRLDPTAETVEGLSTATGLLARMGEALDYVEMLWTTHVVGMNYEQQQRNFYKPLADSLSDVTRGVLGEGEEATWSLTGMFRAAWQWLQGNWFSWRGGLLAMVVSLVGYGAYRLARWLLGRLRQRQRRAAARTGRLAVGFYRRLEAILARHGLRREPGQTPREFATAAGGQMADTPNLRGAAALPRRIVDAFYQVRFGRQEFDAGRLDSIDADLHKLESALRNDS